MAPEREHQNELRTYHPQGMVIIQDTIYVSSVQTIIPTERYAVTVDGHDRTPGEGVGYLFKVDLKGNLIDKIILGDNALYHPGGIDFDGQWIWVPVAEYRPHSSSNIYQVAPSDMNTVEVFRFRDHIGGLVFGEKNRTLHGLNWGSRTFYTWKLDEQLKPNPSELNQDSGKPNGSFYIAYQDCHFIGQNYMLFCGLSKYTIPDPGAFAFGGLELVDLQSGVAIHQIPVSQWVKPTLVMTNNPFYFEPKGDHLRFYFLPEDDDSTIYVFDVF